MKRQIKIKYHIESNKNQGDAWFFVGKKVAIDMDGAMDTGRIVSLPDEFTGVWCKEGKHESRTYVASTEEEAYAQIEKIEQYQNCLKNKALVREQIEKELFKRWGVGPRDKIGGQRAESIAYAILDGISTIVNGELYKRVLDDNYNVVGYKIEAVK